MLDIGFIREREDEIQQAADRKGIALSIGELLAIDDRRRALQRETETLRAERNRSSKAIQGLLRAGRGDEAERAKKAAASELAKLKELEEQFRQTERMYDVLMLQVPNVISPDTPAGASDRDNVELRRAGELPAFGFEPRSHVQLGESLAIVDLARGVKIGGARQYVLKNAGLLLHRAVQQLALDLLLQQRLRPAGRAGAGEGRSDDRDRLFSRQPRPELCDPRRRQMARRDVGGAARLVLRRRDRRSWPSRSCSGRSAPATGARSARPGRDVHGLYRVHQFAKVEQVVICRAEMTEGLAWLERLTANSEELLGLLELPYRVVAVCGGDMSQKNYKQYDIETWMPSRDDYGETHSASLLLDFQARRSNIRYRDEDGQAAARVYAEQYDGRDPAHSHSAPRKSSTRGRLGPHACLPCGRTCTASRSSCPADKRLKRMAPRQKWRYTTKRKHFHFTGKREEYSEMNVGNYRANGQRDPR